MRKDPQMASAQTPATRADLDLIDQAPALLKGCNAILLAIGVAQQHECLNGSEVQAAMSLVAERLTAVSTLIGRWQEHQELV